MNLIAQILVPGCNGNKFGFVLRQQHLQLLSAFYLKPGDRFDLTVFMASNRIRKRSGSLQSGAGNNHFVDDWNAGDFFTIQPRKNSGVMSPETARADNKGIDP